MLRHSPIRTLWLNQAEVQPVELYVGRSVADSEIKLSILSISIYRVFSE